MPPAVLIIASTRAHADSQEILRIQDTVSAILEQGRSVDVLVPRITPLLATVLKPAARVFTLPRLPFIDDPPRRPSLRRFITAVFMLLRAASLVSRRAYAALHGVNDGALVARALDRCTVRRYPYIAEIHTPLSSPGFFKGPRAAVARALEHAALRHAEAVILPDNATLARFAGRLPLARTSIIPDPHTELAPDAFTVGEFNTALAHIYTYVLRPPAERHT